MSGHSHWHSIKYQKSIADQKRGKIFSKIAREISIAAKEGGGDSSSNSSLRFVIEKGKKFNMPKENIERAIKRGTGEIEGATLEPVFFEAYGPGNVALIIKGITDNKNRTLSEVKRILNQGNGKLANEGSVKWMFGRKGCVVVDMESQKENFNKEDLVLKAIEAGTEEFHWRDDVLYIYVKTEELENIKKNLEAFDIEISSTTVDWMAKDEIDTDQKTKDSCEKLFELLDENDAIQEIYSNLKD